MEGLSVGGIWGVDGTRRTRSRGPVSALAVDRGAVTAGERVFVSIWPVVITEVPRELVLESPRCVIEEGCIFVFPFPEMSLSEICATDFVIETVN
jgi:hypothetical protein